MFPALRKKKHPQSFCCFGLKFSTISGPFMIWFNDQFCKTKNLWSTFSPHNHPHFPLLITAPHPPLPPPSPLQPNPFPPSRPPPTIYDHTTSLSGRRTSLYYATWCGNREQTAKATLSTRANNNFIYMFFLDS